MFKSIGRLALFIFIATTSIAPVQLCAMNSQVTNGNVSFLSKSFNHLKSAANYALATVKSDLGLNSLEEAQKEAEYNATLPPLNNLKRQFLKASRLFCYKRFIMIMLEKYILKLETPKDAVQFKTDPSFKDSVLIAPIIEEVFFTALPITLLGKEALYCSPLIFGAAHIDPSRNENLNKLLFLQAALGSLLRTRTLYYNRGEFLVGVMDHMINNAIAHWLINRK